MLICYEDYLTQCYIDKVFPVSKEEWLGIKKKEGVELIVSTPCGGCGGGKVL